MTKDLKPTFLQPKPVSTNSTIQAMYKIYKQSTYSTLVNATKAIYSLEKKDK